MLLLLTIIVVLVVHPALYRSGRTRIALAPGRGPWIGLAVGILFSLVPYIAVAIRLLNVQPLASLGNVLLVWLGSLGAGLLIAYAAMLLLARYVTGLRLIALAALTPWAAFTLWSLFHYGPAWGRDAPLQLLASLVPVLGTAAFLILSFRTGDARPPTRFDRRSSMLYHLSKNEPQRLLEGAAATGRFPGKAAFLNQEFNHTNARPPGLGVQRDRIVAKLEEADRRRLLRAFAYTVLLAIVFVALIVDLSVERFPILGLIALSGAMLYTLRCLYIDRYTIAADYAPWVFNNRETETYQPDDLGPADLIVYPGVSPMSAFGVSVNSAVLTVDAERGPDGAAMTNGTRPEVRVSDIEDAIAKSVAASGVVDTVVRRLYFVQGANVPNDLLLTREGPPHTAISPEWVSRIDEDPHAPIRRYLWMAKAEWSGDLVLNYFVRIFRSGGDLSLELHAIYMPPIGWRYRWVDSIPPRSLQTLVADLAASPLLAIWEMLSAPVILLTRALAALVRILVDPTAAIARAARNTVGYDYGAPLPLRRQASEGEAMSFFHLMDRRVTEMALTGRILRTFADYLDELGIDTADLREQRSVMLNQGVIVNNGDFKAENVATGIGARISQTARNVQQAGARP